MKYCEKCKLNVKGSLTHCPLCQSELISVDGKEEEIFPECYNRPSTDHLVLRILAFISIIVAMVSLVVNFMLPTKVWWSVYVLVILVGGWLSLWIAIVKRKNILKYLLQQSMVLSVLAVFFDYYVGGYGWSITYVIPIIFTLAMIIMYILSKMLHLQVGDYMIYLLLDAFFGIIPILFLILDWVTMAIPSTICIMVSIISVIGLIVFEGNNMYSELKRRFHI